ncbi:Ig-like domain repeat protein, partial [Dietzia sp. NPDC055343]
MKNRLRKPVALLGTLVMAGALIITGNAAASAASKSHEYGSPSKNWKITRTIENTSPKVGDTVTVKAEVQRRVWTAALFAYKDLHPECLEYVEGSAKIDGKQFSPQVVANDHEVPGMGFVRWSGRRDVFGAGSGWDSPVTFEFDYIVTSSCDRESNLESTSHVSGDLGGDQNLLPSVFNGGPYIQIQKDVTSVALAAEPTSAVVDQGVTFTVTTAGIGDGGTVDISGDGEGSATATVNRNSATFTRSFDSIGNKNVAVSFAGNAIAKPAGPATASVEIGKISSKLSIAAAQPAFVNTPVPLTATTAGIPDGESIEFQVNGHEVGTAIVAGGTAVYNDWTPSAEETYGIQAFYRGSTTVEESRSIQVSVSVTERIQQTTTTLAVDPDPVPEKASTLTATVNYGNDGHTVEFFNSSQPIGTATLSGGTASIDWIPNARQANQPYSLTARYAGSTGYASSTSDPVAGTVGLVQTTVSVVDAPAAGTVGQQMQLKASVTGGTAGEMIEFRDADGNKLTSASLSALGGAAAMWTPTTPGTYQVTAHYMGTSDTNPSNSPSATTITVGAKQSSITLDGPASASVGQTATLTAATSGIADGEIITFTGTGTVTGTGTGDQDRTAVVANGQATLEWAPSATGTYQIRAVYAGSDTVDGSQSDVLDVVVGLAQTQTSTVTASSEPVTGAPVTLSATVTGGSLGADVVFRDGTADLCTAQLGGDGTAACEWIPTQIGAVNVTAHYAGDDATAASQSSSPTTVTVGQGTVAMPGDLVVTPAAPDAGQSVTVSGTAPAGSLVEVYTPDNAQECTATATAAGTFTCDLGPLPAGTATISAVATLNSVPSQIATTTVTVDKVTPVLTLTGPASVKPGQTVTLDLVTKGIADGQSVAILVNDEEEDTVTVTGGQASYQWTPAAAGSYTIRASYAGFGSVDGNDSNDLTVTVDALSSNTSRVTATPTSVPVGGTVTLAATVTHGTEGVHVEFRNGEEVLCSDAIGADGTATCEWDTDAVGTFNVVAHYVGEAGVNNPSHSAQPTKIEVGKTASTVALTATSPVEVNGSVTFELKTTGIADGQTVDIKVGGAVVASPAISDGKATATWTAPAAPATLTAFAEYAGNATVGDSESDEVTIDVGKAATWITDVTTASEATVGVPVALSATVTGGTDGVNVEFRDGTNVLCTGQVAADGTVECPWTPTSTGTVQVTAHYA